MCLVRASSNQSDPGRISSRMRGVSRRSSGTLTSAVTLISGAMKSAAMWSGLRISGSRSVVPAARSAQAPSAVERAIRLFSASPSAIDRQRYRR